MIFRMWIFNFHSTRCISPDREHFFQGYNKSVCDHLRHLNYIHIHCLAIKKKRLKNNYRRSRRLTATKCKGIAKKKKLELVDVWRNIKWEKLWVLWILIIKFLYTKNISLFSKLIFEWRNISISIYVWLFFFRCETNALLKLLHLSYMINIARNWRCPSGSHTHAHIWFDMGTEIDRGRLNVCFLSHQINLLECSCLFLFCPICPTSFMHA